MAIYKLSEERREEISQIILKYFMGEEGCDDDAELYRALVGIPKRMGELSTATGIPRDELAAFCWEIVKAMVDAAEETTEEGGGN